MTDGWPGISAHVWHGLQPMAGQLLAVLALATIAGAWSTSSTWPGCRTPAPWWSSRSRGRASPRSRRRARSGHSSSTSCRRSTRRSPDQESWLRQAWLLLSGHFAGPLSRLGAALRRLVSLRLFPEALMKIGVLLVALMVAYEVPHAGKTLLQPFTAFAVNVKQRQAEVPTVSPQAGHRPRASSITWSTCSAP